MTSKEALENIKDNYPLVHPTNYKLIKESYDTLEELFDRDTPKKIEYDDFEEPCCPVCGEVQCSNVYATNNNGCPYCLQRLDWSE